MKYYSFTRISLASLFNRLLLFASKIKAAEYYLCLAGIIIVAVAVFFIYFNFTLFHYHSLQMSQIEDQGIANQIFWKITHLGKYDITIRQYKNCFGSHFSPIFFLLMPLYLISPTPATLFIITIAGLCFTGIVIYLISQNILQKPLFASAIALLFFCSVPFANLAIMGFNAILISVPFFALAILFYLHRSFGLMLASLILASLCKEDVPLIMTGFGLLAWIDGRERYWRWVPPIIGLSYFLVVFSWIMPWLNMSSQSGGTGFDCYNYLGENLREILGSLIFKVPEIWSHLTRAHILAFWIDLLKPVLFLPLLSPFFLFVPYTQFAIIFLSDWHWYASIDFWYYAPTYPFVMTASAYALAKIGRWFDFRAIKGSLVQSIIIIVALYFSLTGNGMNRLLDAARAPSISFPSYLIELINSVPADASLTTQTDLVTYFYKRDKLYLPYKVPDTDYVLLNFKGNSFILSRQDFIKDVETMLRSGRYLLITKVNNYYLFKQVDEAPVYEELIKELRQSE